MRYELSSPKKKRIIWYPVALLLILFFIWGQSSLGGKTSTNESTYVTDGIVNPLVKMLVSEKAAEKVKEPLIRKLAHIAEYSVLGLMIGLILRNRRPRFWLCLLIGMAVAFIDETIQIFSHRGPLITDIWIDLIGVALGGAVSLLFRPDN